MSWLARSIANSLTLNDDEDDNESISPRDDDDVNNESRSSAPRRNKILNEEQQSFSPEQIDELQSHGIKEDLTLLKDTFTRQLFGVASFLAPPPPPLPPTSRSSTQFNGRSNHRSISNLNQSEPLDQSIRVDFREIGATLSEMSPDYYPIGPGENDVENEFDEDQEFDVIGITDEVLAFASNIAHHPETWLDFPLDPDDDLDDFDMSIEQQDHAMAIEYLSPRLAALRIELCPCHMSDGYFWKVYFVLLHSRLSKTDAEILSTPQVMDARALWMKELQKKTKPETDRYGGSTSHLGDSDSIMQNDINPSSNYFNFESMSPRSYALESASSIPTDYEVEKHPVESTEIPFVDKPVIEEKQVSDAEIKGNLVTPSSKRWIPDSDDEEIVWPEDDGPEFGGYSGAEISAEDVEDISFSDLEDFDDISTPTKSVSLKRI